MEIHKLRTQMILGQGTQASGIHLGVKCILTINCTNISGELKCHGTTHSGQREYSCDQCGSAFTKQSSLGRHKFRHTGIKPHRCDACYMKLVLLHTVVFIHLFWTSSRLRDFLSGIIPLYIVSYNLFVCAAQVGKVLRFF